LHVVPALAWLFVTAIPGTCLWKTEDCRIEGEIEGQCLELGLSSNRLSAQSDCWPRTSFKLTICPSWLTLRNLHLTSASLAGEHDQGLGPSSTKPSEAGEMEDRLAILKSGNQNLKNSRTE